MFTGDFNIDGPRIALCFNSQSIVSLWACFKQGRAESEFSWIASLGTGISWRPCMLPAAVMIVSCLQWNPYSNGFDNTRPGGCFSADSIAIRSDGIRVALRDLKLWDRVRVSLPDGAVSTSSAFFVQHAARVRTAAAAAFRPEVLQVSTAGGHRLHVTAQHFLPVSAGGGDAAATYALTVMTPAHHIRVGDGVWTTEVAGAPSPLVCSSVHAISVTSVPAVLNPLTFSGTIIVDGVAASVYALYINEALLGGAANVRYVPAILQLLARPAHAVITIMRHLPAPLGPALIAAATHIGELLDDDALAPAPVRSALGISCGLALLAAAMWTACALALLALSLALPSQQKETVRAARGASCTSF